MTGVCSTRSNYIWVSISLHAASSIQDTQYASDYIRILDSSLLLAYFSHGWKLSENYTKPSMGLGGGIVDPVDHPKVRGVPGLSIRSGH